MEKKNHLWATPAILFFCFLRFCHIRKNRCFPYVFHPQNEKIIRLFMKIIKKCLFLTVSKGSPPKYIKYTTVGKKKKNHSWAIPTIYFFFEGRGRRTKLMVPLCFSSTKRQHSTKRQKSDCLWKIFKKGLFLTVSKGYPKNTAIWDCSTLNMHSER